MSHHAPRPEDAFLTRRDLLRRGGMGFGTLGLAGVLADAGDLSRAARAEATDLHPAGAEAAALRRPRRKRVVHLFMNGGPSQVDTFDPKPLLDKYHGKPLPSPNLRTERKTGAAMRSPFAFRKYGQSGIEVSELFADDGRSTSTTSCVIRSMHADVPNHEPSLMLMNCGDGRLPRPSMGSWVTYGLGTREPEPARLHRHVPGRLSDRRRRRTGSRRSCPACTRARTSTRSTPTIEKLIENIRNDAATAGRAAAAARPASAAQRAAPGQPASDDAAARGPHPVVRAGLPHADRRRPTPSTSAASRSTIRDMYGDGVARPAAADRPPAARARRALRPGLAAAQGQPWDNHDNLEKQHRKLAERVGPADRRLPDRPQAARAARQHAGASGAASSAARPVAELPAASTAATTTTTASPCGWPAAACKGGHVHGATDEFGFARRREQGPRPRPARHDPAPARASTTSS